MKINKQMTYNLYTNMIEEKEIKEVSNNYFIRGFNSKGKTNFNSDSQTLKYNEIIYYDIETIKIGEKINKEDTEYKALNLSNNIMYSFSLLIPKNTFKRGIKKIKSEFSNVINEDNKYSFNLEERENYYLLFYYNEDTKKTLEILINLFIKLRNNKKDSLKVIGFNNNGFDDLIFKHFKSLSLENIEETEQFNLFRNEAQKTNRTIIKLNDKDNLMVNFYDSRNLSKNFGLNNLKSVGTYIKLEKLEIFEKSNNFNDMLEVYKNYNNRDNEIVYYFMKEINNLGIYETNIASWSRKYFYNIMFKKLEVKNITVSQSVNKFNLFGGRTESYVNKIFNTENEIKYIDFNSLYTSSRVVLDIVKGVKSEDNETYDYKMVKYETFNYIDSILRKIRIDLYKNESKDYTYKTLEKIYNKATNNFFMLKVRLKGINKLFKNKEDFIKFYFPFVRKEKGKSSFSFSDNEIYEISFYEVIFLSMFDYEIIECYEMEKGEDLLKEDLINIYENRKVLKKEEDKRERLEKLKLNSGYGIYCTKIKESELIQDKRIINNLNHLLNTKDKTNIEVNESIEERKQFNLLYSDMRDTFDIKRLGSDYFKVNQNITKKWTNNSIPLIGLNIVSNSRFMLYSIFLDYIMNNKTNEYKIYYTDTDSLFCDIEIFERLKEVNLIGNELGQLKDELPNETITELKTFAPKTYIYKYLNSDNELIVKKTFKGTGTVFKRTIITQSIKQDFNIIERIALNPKTEQKRYLENNIFYNHFGISEELERVWEKEISEELIS